MFALPHLKRERWFETSWHAFDLRQPCQHKPGDVISVTGTGAGTGHTRKASFAEWREAMGIDWMTGKELSQAIPPAYSEYVGGQLMAAIHG
jgi:DNA (cytosine-5)-methyltransferase 1